MYDLPHLAKYLPEYRLPAHGLTYSRYEWSFSPNADIQRMAPERLQQLFGVGVEGVTIFDGRRRVIIADDQGEFVLRHENRHCKLPFMLEQENHAWDSYEQRH